MTAPISSCFSMSSSKARRRISPRSRGGVAAHDFCARPAASMASWASFSLPSATFAMTLPVAGLMTSMVSPVSASRHCPSMNSPVLTLSMIDCTSMLEPSFLVAPVPVYAPESAARLTVLPAGQRLICTADEAPLTTDPTARFRCAHRAHSRRGGAELALLSSPRLALTSRVRRIRGAFRCSARRSCTKV